MRRHLAVFILIALGCRQAQVQPPAPRPAPPSGEAPGPAALAALVGATVIDASGAAVPDAVVVLEKDRIRAVGPGASTPVPDGAKVVDVSGKWIVPGLVDAHVHFFQSAGLYTRPDVVDLGRVRPYADEVALVRASLDSTLRRTLASGVTAVVDMGGPFWNFEVRDRARASLLAPRVAVAGPLISTVSRPQLDLGDPPIVRAAGPEEARALVQSQAERKPDLVKIWFIVAEDRGLDEARAVVRAAIEEAHHGGLRVAVHATELETARVAVEEGADILVHSVHDAPVDQAFVDLVKSRDVVYIPNLVVLEGYAEVLGMSVVLTDIEQKLGDPEVMSTWDDFPGLASAEDLAKAGEREQRYLAREPVMRGNLAAMLASNVTVAAGTDAGNIGTLHGPSIHRELELLARAGMSPAQVLLAATRDAARVFSADPEFGSIEPGKLADMLVLDADPLLSVASLQRIRLVVKGGVILEPSDIVDPNPAWVVGNQVDAYNRRDLDAFLSWYAPDARIDRLPSLEPVASGRRAIRAVFSEVFSSSPALHCTVLGRTVEGPTVVDLELVTGLRGKGLTRAVAAYEVRGGLITHVWFLPSE